MAIVNINNKEIFVLYIDSKESLLKVIKSLLQVS